MRATYERRTKAGVRMKTELSRSGPNLYFMCIGPADLTIEVRAPLDS